MTFLAWPEIEAFHHIRKCLRIDPGEWWRTKEMLSGTSTVTYRAKIKLHGTNAAVQVHQDGTIICQSRENIITPEKDNAGFARWVNGKEMRPLWFGGDHDFILYGEWCGPGVQKGVALSEIPRKVFAVFAARLLTEGDALVVEPNELEALVGGITDVYVLPWYRQPGSSHFYESLSINWKRTDKELSQDIACVNEWVASVEENDPWVFDTFGIKGTGEGLVFYPSSTPHLGWEHFQNLCFKAKGEKHKNIATAKPAQVSAEAAASVDEFIKLVLTDARLEQGARAILGEHKHEDSLKCLFCTTGVLQFDMKNTGKFVQWVTADVQKEAQDELEASGLNWEQVIKSLGNKARAWYLAKAKA